VPPRARRASNPSRAVDADRATSSLAGKVVLVTRPREQSTTLVRLLRERGARSILAPAIEVVPARSAALTRALRDLAAGDFAWITLTSRATVHMLRDRGLAPRRWARRDADLVPATFTTAALGRAFPRGAGRVLCARADIAPEGLEDALAAKGWRPERVDAYRTKLPRSLPVDARAALREGRVDAVTFTSASTVRGFVGALGVVRGNPKVVCIGPVTAREAREHGLTVAAVAKPHTIEGLVAALERVFAARASTTDR